MGVESSITVRQIIDGVNVERQKRGLSILQENQTLTSAAQAKAQNMFEENYWSHFSPSGKDPWRFIQGSGYKFSYAGENLARNFYNSDDVIKAWMASPSHRANLLNPQYQDIGVVVVDGILQGQKTALIVQMFGTPFTPLANVPPQVNAGGKKMIVEAKEISNRPLLVAGVQNQINSSLIDPFMTMKVVGIFLISFVSILLLVDLITLRKRGIFRPSSHHLAHLGFLAIAGTALMASKIGEIL